MEKPVWRFSLWPFCVGSSVEHRAEKCIFKEIRVAFGAATCDLVLER
jgi:hypothetical protein